MDATLADRLFWVALAASLAVAFVVTVPVNHWMIGRGRGHAVVHEMHEGRRTTTEARSYDLRHAPASDPSSPCRPAPLAPRRCGVRPAGRLRRPTASDPPHRERQPAADCAKADSCRCWTPGTLTVGTDSPAYDPWFSNNDPTNGKGFESAVAYAVAEQLGFSADQVDVGQGAVQQVLRARAEGLRLRHQPDLDHARRGPRSSTSPTATTRPSQAVIALKGTAGAEATSLDDLKGLRLGAQTGTTSLTAIRDVIQPDPEPAVFEDTNAAKQALQNDQVDAILADLPTAFYIIAVEIPDSTIVGQFQPETGEQEEFGMLFEKGSGLVALRQPGARGAAGGRHARRDRAEVALRRRGRARRSSERRLVTEPARARAPAAARAGCGRGRP